MFRFKLTSNVLSILKENRIFLPHAVQGSQWTAAKDWHVSPYVQIGGGSDIPRIGSFSYTSSPLDCKMTIGRYCSLAWNTLILGPEHPWQWATTANLTYQVHAPAEIARSDWNKPNGPRKKFENFGPAPMVGNDVWISQDVRIKRGVVIGNGAVVAAGAFVMSNVPSYAIVGGVPARIIRFRFSEDLISRFQRVQWWDYAAPDLDEFPVEDPVRFLDKIENESAAGRLQKWAPVLPTLYDLVVRI
ncbi:CatB-related O-acetyltransferase [Rhodopila sp.]|uniref:CatB-related O-acetyltransferase n=1 Tax=Rhodopila sp. TaxID=2480087 RepID=UPI002D7E436B|nr:CatB-related O-acetyltransferase [Rhodopila sp.]